MVTGDWGLVFEPWRATLAEWLERWVQAGTTGLRVEGLPLPRRKQERSGNTPRQSRMLRLVERQVVRGLRRIILRRHGRVLPDLAVASARPEHRENVIMPLEGWKTFLGALLIFLRLTVIIS